MQVLAGDVVVAGGQASGSESPEMGEFVSGGICAAWFWVSPVGAELPPPQAASKSAVTQAMTLNIKRGMRSRRVDISFQPLFFWAILENQPAIALGGGGSLR